jgi:hypothetical protein
MHLCSPPPDPHPHPLHIPPPPPQITCFCDRSWFKVERCRLLGALAMVFPITCPADYYFKLDKFVEEAEELGPAIDYREHSFLDNPAAAELRVRACCVRRGGACGCRESGTWWSGWRAAGASSVLPPISPTCLRCAPPPRSTPLFSSCAHMCNSFPTRSPYAVFFLFSCRNPVSSLPPPPAITRRTSPPPPLVPRRCCSIRPTLPQLSCWRY